MSKKKDRLNTQYRACPICGRKSIFITKRKRIFSKEKTYINCSYCRKKTQVKEPRWLYE